MTSTITLRCDTHVTGPTRSFVATGYTQRRGSARRRRGRRAAAESTGRGSAQMLPAARSRFGLRAVSLRHPRGRQHALAEPRRRERGVSDERTTVRLCTGYAALAAERTPPPPPERD